MPRGQERPLQGCLITPLVGAERQNLAHNTSRGGDHAVLPGRTVTKGHVDAYS